MGRGRGRTACRQYPGFWGGGGGGRLHDAIWGAAEGTQVNAVLHIVLFQLGQDVFSIRVLPQGGNVRPDLQTQTRVSSRQENGSQPSSASAQPG